MALTSRDNVKLLLSIATADTSKDALLDLLIAEADVIIENYLDRRIEQATYTEFYGGSGDERLFLKNYPVTSITSIHLDNGGYFGDGPDSFAADTLLTEGSDYVLNKDDASATAVSRSGEVFRINGIWDRQRTRKRGQLCSAPSSGMGNIKVVYVGGYLVVPKDLEHCANRVVVSIYNSRKLSSVIASESFEDYSYNLAGTEEAARALDSSHSVLAHYKRMVV